MVQALPLESRLLGERFRLAVKQLESGLAKVYSYEQLGTTEATGLLATGILRAAWKIFLPPAAPVSEMFLGVDATFPSSIPTLLLRPSDDWFLKIPHVNKNGSLCLLAAHATVDQHRGDEVALELIGMALDLISDGLAGKNRNDFIQEAEGYWAQLAGSMRVTAFSPLTSPSRVVPALLCPSHNRVLLDETRPLLQARSDALGAEWLNGSRWAEALILWSEQPIFPQDYPKTNADLQALAIQAGQGKALEEILSTKANRRLLPIVIVFPIDSGVAAFSASFSHLDLPVTGFRQSSITPSRILKRFGNHACNRHIVERADDEYLRWRSGGDSVDFKALAQARVLIVGCGSLGADVAMLLAKTGINHFTLVDNEVLAWDNIGRHLLGASSVGLNKASATAQTLRAHMPHLEVQHEAARIEDLVLQQSAVLDAHDVIVCLTGDWKSESLLNLWQRRHRAKRVVFGWVEPQGLAGHALLVTRYGGCLGCGRDETGGVLNQIIKWPREIVRSVPACGGSFTPHGVMETAATKQMIAELVLHTLLERTDEAEAKVYIGDPSRINKLGGIINAPWNTQVSSDQRCTSSGVMASPWPSNPDCPLCHAS